MSKKFKKLTLQYAYLQLEKEEVDEICLLMEKEMRIYLEKHHPEQYKAFYGPSPNAPEPSPEPDNPQNEEEVTKGKEEDEEKEPPQEETEEEEYRPSPPKNKDLKKLYRKIAEKTHPDKVGNNQYAQLFSEAASAYEKNDIATLLNIAGSLNIELAELSPESLALLKNNIETLHKEIYMKKQTTGWAWHNTKSDEEKEMIIKTILKRQGVEL